jgi:2'-5' RNA ligase
VIWVGLGGELHRLQALQEEIARVMKRFGVAAPSERFHPHLTLGRTRPNVPVANDLAQLIRERAAPRPVSWSVREVVLMRSELGPSGARYTVLSSIPLL